MIFSKRKVILGFLPIIVSWLFYENIVEVELVVDSYEVTLMSCQNFFQPLFLPRDNLVYPVKPSHILLWKKELIDLA